MMWWKVELDKEGTVASCVPVLERAKGSRSLVYVFAETRELAALSARDWLARYREQQRASRERRTERCKVANLCVYCRKSPPQEGRTMCRECQETKNQYNREWNARGQVPKRPPADPVTARVRRAELGGVSLHAHTVLKQFDALSHEEFRRWLVERIRERQRSAGDNARRRYSPAAE